MIKQSDLLPENPSSCRKTSQYQTTEGRYNLPLESNILAFLSPLFIKKTLAKLILRKSLLFKVFYF